MSERDFHERDLARLRTEEAVAANLPSVYQGPGLSYGFNAGWAAAREFYARDLRRGTPVTPDDNCSSSGHAHFTVPCRRSIGIAPEGRTEHCGCLVRFVPHTSVETASAQKESHRIEYVERNQNGLSNERGARYEAMQHLYPADTPEQTRIRAMRIGCEEYGYVSDIPRESDVVEAVVGVERAQSPLFDILRLVVTALNASTSEERFAFSKAAQDALAAAADCVDRPSFSKEDMVRATTVLESNTERQA